MIDGCIRVNFTSPGQIKKGRTIVTMKDFNGDQLEIVNVYFMYDMEHPEIIAEPMQPGYVCLWSNKWNYKNENIIMDGITYNGISKVFKTSPNCFEEGTVSMVLKPGKYKFVAQKVGNDKERSFEIKSGKCLIYRLP